MRIYGYGFPDDAGPCGEVRVELSEVNLGTTVEEIGELIAFLKEVQAGLESNDVQKCPAYMTLPGWKKMPGGVGLVVDVRGSEGRVRR